MAEIMGVTAPTSSVSPILTRNPALEYQHSISVSPSSSSSRSSSLASTSSNDSIRNQLRGDSFTSSKKSKSWMKKLGKFFKESLEAAGESSRDAIESGAAYPHPGFKLP